MDGKMHEKRLYNIRLDNIVLRYVFVFVFIL